MAVIPMGTTALWKNINNVNTRRKLKAFHKFHKMVVLLSQAQNLPPKELTA